MRWPTRTPLTLILTVLVAALVFGAYGWLTMRVIATNDEALLTASTIDVEALQEGHTRTAERLLTEIDEERLELASLFVTKESIVSFIELLESLGADADVTTTIASVDTEEEMRGAVGSVRVRLVAVGSWRNLVHFVTLLDTLPFVFEVREADLVETETEQGVRAWQGSFTLGVHMVQQ